MKEKFQELTKKLENLKEILMQQEKARKEIADNIQTAEENKKKIEENIFTIRGMCEGIQFSVNSINESIKIASPAPEIISEKKKVK